MLPQAVGSEVQVYVAVTDGFKCYIVPRCLTLPMFGPLKKTEFCTSCFIILEMCIWVCINGWDTLTLSNKMIELILFLYSYVIISL